MERLAISKISYFSILKLLFFGSLPVISLFCLATLFVVLIQGVPENPLPDNLYGWNAVWAALFLAVVWPAMFSVLFGLIIKFGLALILLFKKTIDIEVKIMPTTLVENQEQA